MPRRCTVCDHAKRPEIDRTLVAADAGYRNIAKRFQLSVASVYRHACEHIPRRLVKAQEAREIADADSLLAEVRTLYEAAKEILDTATGAGDHRTALGAIREARGTLELLGRLLGELQDAATVRVNVLTSPEFRVLQATMLDALADYPEARQRVAGALYTLDRSN